MTKIVFALFMTLNIISVYGYVSGQKTCNTTIGKFNEKVAKLVDNAKNQTNEWAVFSDIQSLKGLGFALKYTCINETLKVVTTETTQTPVELQACAKLQEIVESFLPEEGNASYKGGDGKTDALNKEILTAGKTLGENCTITLVAQEDEETEEEENEENEWAWNPTEEEDVLDAEGDWQVEEEEEEDNEEDSVQAQYINKYKPKNIEAESEDNEEEDEEDSIQAQYINKYKPKNIEIESEEEENDEEEDSDLATLNLISVNKKAKNDSGSQWTQGGYENYTNASQWQSGGYQKYYDQNKTSSFLLGF